MDFHEVRFPTNLSFGSVGGPERHTEIVTLVNGFEERNSLWAHSRRRYDAGLSMSALDDIEALIAFFEARSGRLYGFRWKDWSDYRSGAASQAPGALDQAIGTGDGTTRIYPLQKTYVSGAVSYVRPIVKPVEGTVQVALAGVTQVEGVGFTVDTIRGLITFATAPASGVAITAGFEFDVPVRFDTDRIEISMASFQTGEVPSVPVVEVRV